MNSLIGFFVHRPLLVRLTFVAVLAMGAYKMTTIQKERVPAVALNKITVTTTYPGASAEDVELNVTVPLEEQLREVDGISELTSTSREN
ncbi:efflux RND transporter permease subunit, partial [Myxococcota bacterium]|nr:efflux RND transporter permease subunit [Myxococcota bacterium]